MAGTPSQTKAEIEAILAKHRHYCTQPDKFTGLSDAQALAAINRLVQAVEVRAKIAAFEEVQSKGITSGWLQDRIVELTKQAEVSL
jgi:hypothetical protein